MKLKPKILIFTLLFCSFSLLLKAQVAQPGLPNDLDRMFVPEKSSIFNSDGKNDEGSSSNSSVDVKHIIKLNITMLPRSIAAFYYERRLNDQISLEGGLGISFDKDRIMGAVSSISDDFSGNYSSIKLSEMMEYGVSNGKGFFASFSFRVGWDSYYDWNVIPYFEMNTRYYANKMKIGAMNYGVINGSSNVEIRNICYNLVYGVEFLTEGKIQTAHDFYFGFGLRTTSFDKFTSTETNTGSGYSQPLHTNTGQRTKAYAPMFIMGYAFGIGF